MNSRYRDKVVIITGGTQGIGLGCTQAFAAAGAQVVICAARETAEGAAVAAEINARHNGADTAHFIKCDVAQPAEVQNLIAATIEKHGRLDCLINNAGWHPPHKPIDDFTLVEFQALLNLNLVSVFVGCQAALPYLRLSQGNIINMSSLVGSLGQLHAVTYVATKGALTAFTKALAIDEAAHGVRVNAVSPGNIYTPLWQTTTAATENPAKTRTDAAAAQLLGRVGTIEEVGQLCLYLAAEATFTTGVDHIISGGAELGYGRKTRVA